MLNYNLISWVDTFVGTQDEAAEVEVLSERGRSDADAESSGSDDFDSDADSGGDDDDDGSGSGDEADDSRAGPSRASKAKASGSGGGAEGDGIGGNGEEDGEESDGYGDEGLSWEAVMASVGAAPSAEAAAAEAAQLKLQVWSLPTQSCWCFFCGKSQGSSFTADYLGMHDSLQGTDREDQVLLFNILAQWAYRKQICWSHLAKCDSSCCFLVPTKL